MVYCNRPLARPWECSQSGGQNNIFLHENRSQFPEEKISFFFVLQIGCNPMMCKGSITDSSYWLTFLSFRLAAEFAI